MNRLLSASAFLCSTLGLVLMILACFLVPHHVVLGDDPGGGGVSLAPCSGDATCDSGCTTCLPNAAGTACIALGAGGCPCAATPPPGSSCAGCSCPVFTSAIPPHLKSCHCMP
jgi:hypothetical protein